MSDTTKRKRKKRMRLPNGMGSVHRIGGDKARRKPWRARVPSHIEFDEKAGKATQKYITVGYFENELDAIDALMNYRKNPYTIEAASCTFEELYEMWRDKKYPTISKSGQLGYNSAFKNSTPLHKMRIRDIRTLQLDGIMQTIEGGYQVQMRLKVFWGQLFKYAMEHDLLEKNYADFVTTRDKAPETKRTAIPPEDREKIWQAIDAGDADAEIAMIYIYTGMRPTELLLIKKEDVDLENRIMVGGIKTEAGHNRRIPIHRSILPFIEKRMDAPGDLLIMETTNGGVKPMTYDRFRKYHWAPLMERLGMDYTGHYTRHTCATMLREAKVADDLRKLILGHKNEDITDRYTHHTDAMLLEAIDSLPER